MSPNWFQRLFGNEADGAARRNRPLPTGTPSDLLKRATAHKEEGNWSAAIDCLRAAHLGIAKGNDEYPISTFLRLPMYLHASGRRDEAWAEFNKLIVDGYPNQIRKASLIPMDHSAVYDKIRLCLQREKRAREAVKFGILSTVCWEIGLKKQRRGGGFYIPDDVEDMLRPLLKKAKALELMDELVGIVARHVRSLTKTDLGALARDVDAVMLRSGGEDDRQPN